MNQSCDTQIHNPEMDVWPRHSDFACEDQYNRKAANNF